ncbi:inorganic phosphate transporter [Candidatus Desantisbacteria bacterium CG_4_10_14_0_8_um_filter_39_17]|uniref:Inorganic phosphate transporter n=2 Tax=unclassified Candidatus Desantisiibacteriota TaxID=3106372 RepID=A0A2H9PBW7_9BACT|nr:MAG: inorganic phosphate transporter [Candidatus Desantisbacteria bacterium CG_4_10_14_0_8_um_filter_39_17]
MNYQILGGIFLGWSLGANDAANVFGTAVSSNMVSFRKATILVAIFVLLGAVISGMPGLKTLGNLTSQTLNTAFIISLAAGITVTLMSVFGIPVSVSQAVVGAIIGQGILQGQLNFSELTKVIICWVASPLSAVVISFFLYPVLAGFFRKLHLHFLIYDKLMRFFLILAGIYGAYALGANNVANVSGVFYQAKILNSYSALLIGGLSIGFGALTCSRGVMLTVGRRIIPLDVFSSFIVVLSGAIAVHIFALIGVPVSASQSVVGAVFGIGLLKGMKMVNKKTLYKILFGWFLTPLIGIVLSIVLKKCFF